MPGIDGMDVLRYARREPARPAGHPDHGLRQHRPGRRGPQGRGPRLRRQALRRRGAQDHRRPGPGPPRRLQAGEPPAQARPQGRATASSR
ncbi:MAG: hypothetical protein MZU91_00800 [Desulfosudis oleivorans]|nr:hypothetical protein [Desulfosudis oleivorans]